ncbi:unnamed protein product [Calypogeia fissa]
MVNLSIKQRHLSAKSKRNTKAYYGALFDSAVGGSTNCKKSCAVVTYDEDVKEDVKEVGVKAKIEDKEKEEEVEWVKVYGVEENGASVKIGNSVDLVTGEDMEEDNDEEVWKKPIKHLVE